MSARDQHQNIPAARPSTAPSWQRMLWTGGGSPAIRWRSLIGCVVALALSGVAFTVGLSTIRWAMPLKLIGGVALLLALTALLLGLRALIRVILQLGIKRLLILVVVLYGTAVVVAGVLIPTPEQGIGRWSTSAVRVYQWTVAGIADGARAVIAAPEAVRFAATGQRQPVKLPDVDWVDGIPPTPVVAQVLPAGIQEPARATPTTAALPTAPVPSSGQQTLHVSDMVQVVGTDGAPLRARSLPSADAPIVARFPVATTLQIVDGPQTADGRVWWKVRGATGEGWCAAEFLAPRQRTP